jgi:hypothetical protein
VLVWGIEAKKGKDGIDEAKALMPFTKVKQFKQALEDQVKYATEPPVDGVLHKPVFLGDDPTSNYGFVISYFPKSNKVHRALAKTTSDYYKRHGDSFTPLSTEETRALFFRTLAPELDLVLGTSSRSGGPHSTVYDFTFSITNKGPGVGKFVSVYVGYAHLDQANDVNYFLNTARPLGRLLDAPNFFEHGKHFIVDGTVVVYPGEVIELFVGSIIVHAMYRHPPIKFKIFAEGMLPVESEVV